MPLGLAFHVKPIFLNIFSFEQFFDVLILGLFYIVFIVGLFYICLFMY